MKRSLLLLISAFFALGLALSQQGCKVYIVQGEPVATPTPNPFPNAWHIEMRVREQIDRIKLALQNGIFDQETGYLLAQNDALVRRIAHEDRDSSNNSQDLTDLQTMTLDNMLNDNSKFIDDAQQNHQYWAQYFQTENYNYGSSGDYYLYIIYMDHQLRIQQSKVDAGLKSGDLTTSQAKELSDRINVIKKSKINYYRQNNRLDLSEDQVRQLSQMMDDNSRYIRFRLNGTHGKWNKQKFQAWKTRNPHGLDQDNGNGRHWGMNRNGSNGSNGFNANGGAAGGRAPVPTPIPVTNSNVSTGVHGVVTNPTVPTAVPTAKPQLVIATPTPRPVVGSAPTPVPTPKPVIVASVPTAVHINQSNVVVSNPPPTPTVKTTAANPKPTPFSFTLRLLPPGQLVQFLKHADNAVQKALKSGQLIASQAAALNQKLAALHQASDGYLKQNQAKSVTPDQMSQLAKMSAGIDSYIQSVSGESGKGNGNGDKGNHGGNGNNGNNGKGNGNNGNNGQDQNNGNKNGKGDN